MKHRHCGGELTPIPAPDWAVDYGPVKHGEFACCDKCGLSGEVCWPEDDDDRE